MFNIVYDRNFRDGTEQTKEWSVDQDSPDIEVHRIIELWVEGAERQQLESIINGGKAEEYPTTEFAFYGDLARTMYINL